MFENFFIDHNEEDKNELAGIRDILPKKDKQSSNNYDNKPSLTSVFAIDCGFSMIELKKDGSDFEQCPVFKIQECHIGKLRLTGLIVLTE